MLSSRDHEDIGIAGCVSERLHCYCFHCTIVIEKGLNIRQVAALLIYGVGCLSASPTGLPAMLPSVRRRDYGVGSCVVRSSPSVLLEGDTVIRGH